MTVKDYHEVQMGPYSPLCEYLRSRAGDGVVSLSFAEIETVIGQALPDAARIRNEGWWSRHPVRMQARCWLAAERCPEPNYEDGSVAFARIDRLAKASPEEHLKQIKMYLRHAWDMLPWEANDNLACVVYVIHYAEVGLFKVGVSKASTVRPAQLAKAGGVVVDLVRVKNRTMARLVESECLVRVHDHAAEPPLWIAQWAGATEFWRESFALPALIEVLGSIDSVLPRAYQGAWAAEEIPGEPGAPDRSR